MKLPLTSGLLCLTTLLSSCGGGGSSYVPTTPASCTLTLQYANALNNSGISILESTDWTRSNTEVSRSLSCGLQRIQKLSVELCLQHADSSELRARLVAPDSSTQTLPLENATRTTHCLGQDSTSYLLDLTIENPAFANLTQASGQWLVQVRDVVSGYGNGTLIGWSLKLEGLQ